MKHLLTPQRLIILALIGVAFIVDHFFSAVTNGVIVAMSALVADRNTPEREGELYSFPVKAAKKIFNGALVCLNSGVAQPGATAIGLITVGVSQEFIDNTNGNDGDMRVKVKEGVFALANSADADEITLADVGNDCYVVDDQTVAKTDGTGTRSVAGSIVDVDDNGVWVRIQLN